MNVKRLFAAPLIFDSTVAILPQLASAWYGFFAPAKTPKVKWAKVAKDSGATLD
jgi:hypothetical protein